MILLLLLAIAGLVDSVYLTWEHFNNVIPPCSINSFLPVLSDCGKVLTSSYSTIYHVPVALIGVFYYSTLTIWLLGSILSKNKIYRYLVVLQTIAGALASVGFMYIQLAIIKSICAYCTLSALISFAIVALAYNLFRKERFELHLGVYAFVYQQILKPFYFILSPEFIHRRMIVLGSNLAKTPLMEFAGTKFVYQDKSLRQKLAGINFDNPIGLAAGFDYDADLTQALSYLDFGFQSVGTITNQPYGGNRPPMLGRLIKSRSLMVNKGFKNQGAKNISEKLAGLRFLIPLGVSIGVTNSEKIKTLDEAIKDIVTAFKTFEKSAVKNSYYELNISCPNLALVKTVSFLSAKKSRASVDGDRPSQVEETGFRQNADRKNQCRIYKDAGRHRQTPVGDGNHNRQPLQRQAKSGSNSLGSETVQGRQLFRQGLRETVKRTDQTGLQKIWGALRHRRLRRSFLGRRRL